MLIPWRLCAYLLVIANIGLIKSQSTPRQCPPQEIILPCRCLLREQDIQIWCSHSNLPKVLEGLRAVGKYLQEPIDELILENNQLPSLPGKTFVPIRVMRLMLRYNGLERVSSGWLAGLEASLMELFIVEPKLRSLPEDSLDRMISLEAITIQSNLIKRLPRFSALPRLRHLQIESSSLVEITARHFRDLPLLEKLHVSGSPRLTRLEGGLLQDLPKLSLVNISYCGISWMHPRAITHLPSLSELWLVGNRITDAATVGRSIRDLPALEELHLDENHIDKLNEAAFVDIPSLKRLYMANNKITEIHHGAFHRVPKLRMLDLNKNLVRRVHPESFLQHSASGLEELWLVDNDISHVAELRAILDALPRLIFLDMSNNRLEAIPFGALRGHPTLERLHLDHNKIHLIDRESFMAMPALRELRLKNNSLSDVLNGPLWNLPALKGLDLSDNYFRRIEPQFLANLPSLRKIDLSENELTFIDPAGFMSTPALEHVNISYNHLSTLHPAIFRHLVGLYELDLSNNRLIEFTPGLPRGIEYLYMSKNKISTLPAPPSPDLNLPSLKLLDLSSNEIQTIEIGTLSSLPKLKKLYIGKNYIQNVEDGSLNGLSRLEILDLNSNKILQIYPNALKEIANLRELKLGGNRLNILRHEVFQTNAQLKKLDISGNQLSEISSDTLHNTRDIQVIDASNNLLVFLPTNVHGLKHLRILDLTNNHLRNINSETLRSLVSLTELRMSQNLIQDLRKGAFDSLMSLKVIHLDNNNLELVEPYAFNFLPAVRTLKLNKNKIKEIPNHTFHNLPSLQVLELQENQIKAIANNAFHEMPHLLMLNLSNNQLLGLEEAGLKSLRSLEMLDLTNNRITQVSSGNLAKMEWLVELKLDNNFICSVHGSPFNGMPRLRVLSMKNNRMVSFPEQAVQKLRENLAVLDINGNPLICSCNMLWFRAWLQESSKEGPDCADGGLLREMRLSRQECMHQSRLPEPVAPGCEAELLTAPGATSQMYMNLKQGNGTFNSDRNKLAPEESDYFYDQYVDYPYNETVMDASLLTSRNPNKSEPLIAGAQLQNSPHYTAGDTPTIYAASIKNKTNANLLKGANSPSTSGFTFFGVPLPNFNLNLSNLWTRGNGRMSGSNKTVSSQIAERKTAIMNHPPQILHGGYVHRLPPNMPEVQNGGFYPMLPESGGFKPIANPHQQISVASIERVNVTELEPSEELIRNLTFLEPFSNVDNLDSETMEQTTQLSSFQEGTPPNLLEILHPTPKIELLQIPSTPSPAHYGSILSYPTVITSFNQEPQDQNNPVSIASHPTQMTNYGNVMNKTHLSTKLEIAPSVLTNVESSDPIITKSFIKNIVAHQKEILNTTNEQGKEETTPIVQSSVITTSTPSFEQDDATDRFEDTFKDYVDDVSLPPVVSSTTLGTSIKPPVPTVSTIPVSENNANAKVVQTFTPLSALLVPGGQQPQYKPQGRPVITRVQSPHNSNSAPLSSSLEIEKEKPLSLTHVREDKQFEFDAIITTQRMDTRNQDLSWYYTNYNKTNVEPYIGPGGYFKNLNARILPDKLTIFLVGVCLHCLISQIM